MQHLEGSGTPVLYIERTVLKGYLGLFINLYFPLSCSITHTSQPYFAVAPLHYNYTEMYTGVCNILMWIKSFICPTNAQLTL